MIRKWTEGKQLPTLVPLGNLSVRQAAAGRKRFNPFSLRQTTSSRGTTFSYLFLWNMGHIKKSYKMFMYRFNTNNIMNIWVPDTWLMKENIARTIEAPIPNFLSSQLEVNPVLNFVLITALSFFSFTSIYALLNYTLFSFAFLMTLYN